jgi:glyoxylase-like metal-dependent hydrolase (beta-lactamase superfamily II)/rhodanese-related sulfurtransferase
MKFVQYYLACLSQASYLVGDESTGAAVVVDPRRDIEVYLRDAQEAGLRIEHVIETHVHADFLSGHLELAAATGADIIYGEAARTEFAHRGVADGERLSLGEVVLEFRSTPGHTPESISIVVWEHGTQVDPYAVLTGDTLFIGDVGRPDLLSSAGVTAEELGGQLYDSLHTKLMTLPDETLLYPGHGAGSSCGKNLSSETVCTIGRQREHNYAVQPMTREQFVAVVTEGQPTAPGYFSFDADQNRSAHELFDAEALAPLDLDAVLAAQRSGAVVLDVRDAEAFGAGHLTGSVNVGLDGRFAEYAGEVLDPSDRIVLLTPSGAASEAHVRLARIGFDQVVGALEAPEAELFARPDVVRRASRLTVPAMTEALATHPDVQLVDVRGPGERAQGAVPGSVSIPLAELRARSGELDLDRPVIVHCAGGYRSSIAASWLRRAGAHDVSDLLGGYAAYERFHPRLQETS